MSKKNKRYSDSRLREIALMASKGLPAELIAEIKGLPPKSVANICWIYKWSPEKLDETTERCKHRGKRGGYARSCLRQYFIMHPEQRPSPLLNLFREDQNKPEPVCQSENPETMREADRDFVGDFKRTLCQKVDAEKILRQYVIDGNAHSRIEELKGQVDKLEERSHMMAKCSDEQVLNVHKRLDALTPQIEGLMTQVTHLTKKYDELSTEQIRPVIKVDHRLDAMTRQIERLQDILTEIAEILQREVE